MRIQVGDGSVPDPAWDRRRQFCPDCKRPFTVTSLTFVEVSTEERLEMDLASHQTYDCCAWEHRKARWVWKVKGWATMPYRWPRWKVKRWLRERQMTDEEKAARAQNVRVVMEQMFGPREG